MPQDLEAIPGVLDTPTLKTWSKLESTIASYEFDDDFRPDQWVFRGQSSARWALRTSFERSAEGGHDEPAWKYEAAILREFTRRAHHYVTDVPEAFHTLEWLALMRHYGAPCRLLDCTYSFYIAAYFALQNATASGGPAAVWAVNTSWLRTVYERRFPKRFKRRKGDFRFKSPADFKKHFLVASPGRFVAPVNPYRLNERLTAQRGLFLCQGDLAASFMANLIPPRSRATTDRVIRVVLDPSLKSEAIAALRQMNINAATLYPDLVGFAMSLHDWFHLPLTFADPDLKLILAGRFPGDRY